MLGGKVVVVTGGSGLIGQEFVKAIADDGGTPVVADLKEFDYYEFINMDITDKLSIENGIEYLLDKYGCVDALVNCAYPRNKNFGRHFFDVEFEDFSENISINLGGYFLASKIFAKYFLERGVGNIINIASIYGVVPPRFEIYEGTGMTSSVEYAAIKAGLIHLTKYMAAYFKDTGIRVNSLSPGGILDGQHEKFLEAYKGQCLSKGMLDAKDICGALLFLLSDASKYVNGQNIIVDDGFTN